MLFRPVNTDSCSSQQMAVVRSTTAATFSLGSEVRGWYRAVPSPAFVRFSQCWAATERFLKKGRKMHVAKPRSKADLICAAPKHHVCWTALLHIFGAVTGTRIDMGYSMLHTQLHRAKTIHRCWVKQGARGPKWPTGHPNRNQTHRLQ